MSEWVRAVSFTPSLFHSFTNKVPGSAMIVCSDQPTPGGWETLGVATSTGQCGGAGASSGNIKSIRRIV